MDFLIVDIKKERNTSPLSWFSHVAVRCCGSQSPGQAEKSISSPKCQLIVSLTPISKTQVSRRWMASLGASSSNRIQTQWVEFSRCSENQFMRWSRVYSL